MKVYSLTDPRNNVLRYIGITSKSGEHRLRTHIKDAKTRSRKGEFLSKKDLWLLELITLNLTPQLNIIEADISEVDAVRREKELIALFKRVHEGGILYNVQEGGYYDSKKATPWNRGLHGCYTTKFIENNRIAQPNSKGTYVFKTNGELVGYWHSVRRACADLNLDRRTVMRCLKGDDFYHSHKGYVFSHIEEFPKFINRSTINGSPQSKWNRPIIAIKNGEEIQYDSVSHAATELSISRTCISNVLIGRQKSSHGYKFRYV